MSTRRQSLADFRRELGERFRLGKRSAGCVRALSARIDEELRRLWVEAMAAPAVADSGPAPARACLIATGGYGRRQLFPGSDIDVLVLCPEGRQPQLDAAVRAFLAAAWDLGLELAQAVRTVSGIREFAAQDLSGYTALLDARRLCGDPGLYAQLTEQLRARTLWPPAEFLRAKIEFDQFDALSRTRALTDDESRAMERAMRRMQDWEAAL